MFCKMIGQLLVVLAAVACYANGNPLEVPKRAQILDYDPKYFTSARIVGGVDAPESYGKHMAALVYGNYLPHLICGGSIVTKRHILTAAHCIDSMVIWNTQELFPSFRAIIGAHKWSRGTTEVQFSGYVLHDKWDWISIKYDIGVLKLAEDIQTSDAVTILPLKRGWVDGGARSYVTGWGRLGSMSRLPEKLQLLYVNTISDNECQSAMLKATESLGPAPPVQANIEICTLHSPGHGMCNGDSGSPLIIEATQEQIGLVSWGFPCARGIPDVHVRVSAFIDWLEPIIGDIP